MRTKKLTYILVAGALILSAFTNSAKAGDSGRFSVGAELALPMGDFGDLAGIGFGGSVRYEMPMGDNLGLMGTVGYLTFSGKDLDLGLLKYSYTYSMVPIMVGAKYYFTEQQNGFYGSFQLGITMTSVKVEIPEQTTTYFGVSVTTPASSSTASSSDLSFAPGIGYHLANIDLGLGYNIISAEGGSLSYLGVRIAYVFGDK